MTTSRGASVIGRQCPGLPPRACLTHMAECSVSREFIAVRCSDTLETGKGITYCGVTAPREANAVKVFRAESVTDKQLK